MKTYPILFEHTGQNSDTAKDPVAVYQPGMHYRGQPVALTETVICCLNWDDDRPVPTPRWAVIEVSLPDWLPPQEWIRQTIAWSWAWGLGLDPTWPEAWQRGLAYGRFSEAQRFALIKLLKTERFRSEFRRSLRAQVVAWLDSDPATRNHPSPLSPKQFQSLLNRWDVREAQRRSSGMYYGYRYREMTGV